MKDVLKMKLKVAQSYLRSLKDGTTQTSAGAGISIKIYASVRLYIKIILAKTLSIGWRNWTFFHD